MRNKIILALSVILMSSCYSTKYSSRYMDKLQEKNPSVFKDKMTKYHKCDWIVIPMTPQEKAMADSLFSLSK